MEKFKVYLEKYVEENTTISKILTELFTGSDLPLETKIFIKPNLVFWNTEVKFPKWGVLTTTRVVAEVVKFLHQRGFRDITIGEGMVTLKPKDPATLQHAYKKMGYYNLREQYGVNLIDVFQEDFVPVKLTENLTANFCKIAVESDLIIDLPVLKTHSQTRVSLGIKNLKGLIDINSRKDFHSHSNGTDLSYKVSNLANKFPNILTIIDGLYTLERGPSYDGKAHHSDILIGSWDVLSADLVGAKVLGQDPKDIPYLVHAANYRNRQPNLSEIEVIGEKIEGLLKPHSWEWIYTDDKSRPLPFEKAGITGLNYYQYDDTLCTYCSGMNGLLLNAFYWYWKINKKSEFPQIEVLTGKDMEPRAGMEKTILLGKCMYEKNKDHPNIKQLIAIPGCPPSIKSMRKALDTAGVMLPDEFWKSLPYAPGMVYKKYKGKEGFTEKYFKYKKKV